MRKKQSVTRLTSEARDLLRRVDGLREKAQDILRGAAGPEDVRAWDLYATAYHLLDGEDDDVRQLRVPALARAYLQVIDYEETRETIEGRGNWEALAREFLTTVSLVRGEHEIARSLQRRAIRAEAAKRVAKKRAAGLTPYMKLLADYEQTELKVKLKPDSPLKQRRLAARELHTSLSYLTKLLKTRNKRY